MKFCKNCKFYKHSGGADYAWYECFVGGFRDVVTGRAIAERPQKMRTKEGRCGPEGNLWEEKEHKRFWWSMYR